MKGSWKVSGDSRFVFLPAKTSAVAWKERLSNLVCIRFMPAVPGSKGGGFAVPHALGCVNTSGSGRVETVTEYTLSHARPPCLSVGHLFKCGCQQCSVFLLGPVEKLIQINKGKKQSEKRNVVDH